MTELQQPLDLRIRAEATDAMTRLVPWRADIAWWIVAIQGGIAILLGLSAVLGQGASEQLAVVLGIGVLVAGVLWAWSAMRSGLPQVVLGWRGARGGGAIMVGILLLVDLGADFLSPQGALVVLGIGLAVVGGAGIAEWWVGRDRIGWRWPTLAGPLLAVTLGVVVLVSRLQSSTLFLQVLALASVAIGGLLLVRAGVLLRQERDLRRATAAPAASSMSTPITQEAAGDAAPAVTVRSAASPRPTDADPPAPGGR